MLDKIIPAPAPGFHDHKLSVRLAGLMGARLLHDGAPAIRTKGVYNVTNDRGEIVPIKLRTSFFDCVPVLDIAGQRIAIAPPLNLTQQLLAWFPMALVFPGRIPGALIGWLFANLSMRVFHSALPVRAKYAIAIANIAIGFAVLIAVDIALAAILKPYLPHGI